MSGNIIFCHFKLPRCWKEFCLGGRTGFLSLPIFSFSSISTVWIRLLFTQAFLLNWLRWLQPQINRSAFNLLCIQPPLYYLRDFIKSDLQLLWVNCAWRQVVSPQLQLLSDLLRISKVDWKTHFRAIDRLDEVLLRAPVSSITMGLGLTFPFPHIFLRVSSSSLQPDICYHW